MMPRVLVVDDEPMMRKSLAETIRRYGAEVMVAANGEEGLQQLHATPARLIF